MPRNTRAQPVDLEAQLAFRRTRRALFPEIAAAFWPDDLPPAAVSASTRRRVWWSQAVLDGNGRLAAATGEIVDR